MVALLRLLVHAPLLVALLGTLAATASAATPVLYVANGQQALVPDTHLFVLDASTGQVLTDIGSIGWGVTGMAEDPTTGVLWGATGPEQSVDPAIITIDTATGQGTLVGVEDPVNGTSGNYVNDLAFDSAGNLWGWGTNDTKGLYSVNKSTGEVTLVAGTVLGSTATGGNGLSFDGSDVLYDMSLRADGDLWTVDTSTGEPTAVATMDGPTNVPVNAAAFDCAGSTLYGTLRTGELVTVNTTTGHVTTIGDTGLELATGAGPDGLAWVCLGFVPSGGSPSPAVFAPIVSSISPNTGGPGTPVAIFGDHFNSATSVLFGGMPTSFVVDAFNHITAVAPPGPSGAVHVQVVNPADVSSPTTADLFTYQSSGPTGPAGPGGPGGQPPTEPIPPPVAKKTGNVAPVSGTILVRLPGTTRFIRVQSLTSIPVGSVIDATDGTVSLTVSDGKGGTFTGLFSGGQFRFSQRLVRINGVLVLITDITLVGGDFSICKTGDTRAVVGDAARRRVVRYLKAQASGKFNVIGKYASGIERGTSWKTTDTCTTTEIKVIRGTIIATNRITKKKRTVKAGHTFIVRRRG